MDDYNIFGTEDDDPNKQLAGLISPTSAAQLTGISRPPDGGDVRSIYTAPQDAQQAAPQQPAQAQAQTISPGAPLSSTYKQQLAGYNSSGAPAAYAASQAFQKAPDPMQPDPNGSLRPGGSNPEAQPGAMNRFQQSMGSAPAQNVAGSKGRGFWGNLLSGVGKVADVAGSIALPGATSKIPGSTLYKRQQLVQQQEDAKSAAGIADTNSQVDERRAKAQQDIADAAKAGRYNPDATKSVTTADGVMQFNPATGKYDQKVGDAPEKMQRAQIITGADGTTYQIDPANPGSAKAIMGPDGKPLSSRAKTEIKQLEIGGRPHQVMVDSSTGAQIKDLGETGEKPITVNAGTADAALDRVSGRIGKPWQTNLDKASSQLEKIDDARAQINGNAEAQAVGIPKVLTALVSGQGSGVRITQTELNAIAHARGVQGDVEGWFNKLSGKGALTPGQQKQLTQILDDAKGRLQRKQSIASATLDRINGASSRGDVLKADTESRKQLLDLEGGAGNEGPAPSGKAVSLAAARALPMNKGKSDAEITKDIQAHGHQVSP